MKLKRSGDPVMDMTQGNLVKTLIRFSVPLILSGLLQQLFNWADAFIVGNLKGELYLAAIGATHMIYSLFIMIITGFTMGLSILSAQQYGKGKKEDLKKILSSFLVVLGGIAFIVGILGIVLAKPFLMLLHTPEDIVEIARIYLQIVLIGIPFIAVYNIYSAVLRGLGDSKVSFLSVLVSSVTNVILDIVFVGILDYDAGGAAAATAISQILMTLFIVCYAIKKYRILRFRIGRGMVDPTVLRTGSRMGVPPAIQSSISSFGNLVLQNFMNSFGTQTVAAITTAYRVDTVIILPIVNLGSGISTMVAQNIGAGNQKRAKKVLFVGMGLMSVVSVFLTMVVLAIGGNLIAMFGITEESTRIGTQFFHSLAWFYIFCGLASAFRGFLEGNGDLTFSSIAGIITLGFRIILSYGMASRCGNMIIAYAEGISWGILLLIYILRYFWKQNQQKREGVDSCTM